MPLTLTLYCKYSLQFDNFVCLRHITHCACYHTLIVTHFLYSPCSIKHCRALYRGHVPIHQCVCSIDKIQCEWMATLAKISWLKHSHRGNLPFLYHKLFKCRHVYRTTTATNTQSTPGIYTCCSLQQLQAEGTGWQDVRTYSTQL